MASSRARAILLAIALAGFAGVLLGQGSAAKVEWVMPGRPPTPNADLKLGMPGSESSFNESKVEWVMPGRDVQSEYTMPGSASRDERVMPGQESRAAWVPLEGGGAAGAFDLPQSEGHPGALPADPHALDPVVAPYALCPDPLLAIVLRASTRPAEIVRAARWIRDNPDPASIDGQRLDPSVKALARFRDVLDALDRDMANTQAIGEAMLASPRAVLDAVQRLRASAKGLGNLLPGPQIRLIQIGPDLLLQPADARLIHTPYYDSYQAFDGQITLDWDQGTPVGSWAGFGIDWSRRTLTGGGAPAVAVGSGGDDGFGAGREVQDWSRRGRESTTGAGDAEAPLFEDGASAERASARGRASTGGQP